MSRVKRGEILTISIEIEGLDIHDAVDTIVWDGVPLTTALVHYPRSSPTLSLGCFHGKNSNRIPRSCNREILLFSFPYLTLYNAANMRTILLYCSLSEDSFRLLRKRESRKRFYLEYRA